MLHREDGRRDEDGDLLASIESSFEGGPHGYFCLPVADIAADEPVHRLIRHHVLFDGVDSEELILGLNVRKIVFELPHEVAVSGVVKTSSDGSLGVHGQKIVGVADDLRLGIGAHLLPSLAAELAERGGLVARADVAGDEVGLRQGDEEFAVFGILDGEKLRFDAEVIGVFLHAEKTADSAVEMDHEVARGQLVELGRGGVIGASPLLAPDGGAVGDLRIGDDGERNVRHDEP